MRTPLQPCLKTLALILIWVFFLPGTARAIHVETQEGLSPLQAADYIHSIIEANRTIYSEVIVERLGVTLNLAATENWEAEDTLLLPAQFLLESARLSNAKGVGMTYRLMSLWPINPKNGPQNDYEKDGLNEINLNPSKPYTRVVTTNGKRIFHAIYPDKGVVKACMACHNNHPKSPRKDFKLGDVMGGILISFPLEKSRSGDPREQTLVAPEVVSDYIHAVLESDRTVYAEKIVHRLQQKNIAFASENWWEDNSLLLPAQFLLDASDLIISKRSDLDFKLISLWPLNPHNGPANEFERKGLEYVARHPIRPFIGASSVGGRTYFQAVYPDFAVNQSCVNCHNNHPNSKKRDFAVNDVMGGIVLTFPTK
ncbi:MAG: hypothetical protein COV67_08545 [Nitrospinae bacterium CG11_big_fil_rev_8_21_14_0_20_56_8]|nr:MAG: hypothetical protein COV67_08545 [Nitrospinae bacterium CG11_big_fil_rev_8_21_14_0_20_56_8]